MLAYLVVKLKILVIMLHALCCSVICAGWSADRDMRWCGIRMKCDYIIVLPVIESKTNLCAAQALRRCRIQVKI